VAITKFSEAIAEIISNIQDEFTNYTVSDDTNFEDNPATPGIYIDMIGFEQAGITANGINLINNYMFDVFLCLAFDTTNIKAILREEGIKLAKFIHNNKWGNNVFLRANVKSGNYEEFNPDFAGVEVWKIEFEQIIYI